MNPIEHLEIAAARRDNLFLRPEYISAIHAPAPPARPGSLDYQRIPSRMGQNRSPYQHERHFQKGENQHATNSRIKP